MSDNAPTEFDLTSSAIKEFQEIYRHEFGDELTPDAATEMANRLLRLYYVLAKADGVAPNSDSKVVMNCREADSA